MAGLRVHTVMSQDLVGRLDAAASSLAVSRGEFVRRAVEQALGVSPEGGRAEGKSPTPAEQLGASEQALGSSGRAGVRGRVPAPVPAEQPVDVDAILGKAAEGLEFNRGPRVRSSAAARPFRPAPKKGEK